MSYLWVSLTLLAAVGSSALAQPIAAGFWTEGFVGAEIGAMIGGALGLSTVHTACLRVERSCDPLLVILRQRISLESILELNSPGVQTVNMGRGLGALAGVALMGIMQRVEGNIWAAFVATQAWVAASRQILLLKAPLVPALVATVAYSWGAKPKSRPVSSQPAWSFTMVTWRF